MRHRHDFVPIRVRHRKYASGAHRTDVESMCECGKTRVRSIAGWWELSEVRNPQGTVRSAAWGLTP